MNILKSYTALTLLVAAIIFQSCEKDNEKAAPVINSFTITSGNSTDVMQNEYLFIEANITAEAKIHTLSIEIYPDLNDNASNSEWGHNKTYENFNGLSSLIFTDSVLVPENTLTGKYICKITIIDNDANSTLETNKFTVIKAKVVFNTITGFVFTEDNTIYIGTDIGLLTFDEHSGTYSEVNNGMQITNINTLALSPEITAEELWLGTSEGAYNFATSTNYNTNNSGIHHNTVNYLCIDFNNRAFFGTPLGVSIKDGENWILNEGKILEHQKVEIYSAYQITGMGTATNGYTYVATNGGGIERFKYDVDGITGATIFDTDWTYLESNTINNVYVYDTVQYYGTPEGAAVHYSHLTKWDWQIYNTSHGLIDNNVISITRTSDGTLWFGTENGLSCLKGENWTSYTKESNNILSNHIKFLATAPDGSVWFANNDGLCRFKDSEWTNFAKN